MWRLLPWLFLLLGATASVAAPGEFPLRFGVLELRPEPQMRAQWQPVASYLERRLGRPVEIAIYDHAELSAAVDRRAVDLVATSPGHFVLLQQTGGLSAALATVVTKANGVEASAYGGVIFALRERSDIASLRDLAAKRVAAVSRESFGGFQLQAFELMEAGVPLPKGDRLRFTALPQDRVIDEVLAGRADVGFVRSGAIESLAREGRIDPAQFRIINRQNLPSFPDVVSTPLYPDWPVAVMPQVERQEASRIAAALLSLPHGSLGGEAIHGFETAANYDSVQTVLRRLHLPPYDQPLEITPADLWHRYARWISALTAVVMLLAVASAGLVILYRRAQRSAAAVRELYEALEGERRLFIGGPNVAFRWRAAEGWPVEYASPNIRERFGFAPEDFTSGRIPYASVVHPEDLERVGAEVARFTASGVPWFEQEYRIRRPEGGYRWVYDFTVIVRDAGGKVIAYHGYLSDSTERHATQEELEHYRQHLEELVATRTHELARARDAAEAANKAKSVFLANMSHELRTPLNAILGFSTIMRKDAALPEVLSQYLDIINRSGEHLLSLINDVLEMAKIEAGRVHIENAAFDLGDLVRDVTDMMELRAREKGLRLVVDQTSEFPRYIVGDEGHLRQVLINLVGNAVKFTSEGGVTLRLGTRANKVSHLIVEVEDTGPGISPADQQRIFQPFVQLGEQRENKGTGLGLTITRQFVQMMGGNITLQSTPGKGSLFRVDLPLTEATAEGIARAQAVQQGSIIGLEPGQQEYRILIVEDQLENQLLLSKLMESVGFRVKVVENGEQGVDAFIHWRPHLIWMDRKMPVMDGLEATRRIRTLPGGREVKVIAVTASAFQEERDEMIAAGMDDFVRKPYRFGEIYDCLTRHLGVRYLREETAEPERPIALTPEMLQSLPLSIRESLRVALERLDSQAIDAAIGSVDDCDPALAGVLSRIAERFDYQVILDALSRSAPAAAGVR